MKCARRVAHRPLSSTTALKCVGFRSPNRVTSPKESPWQTSPRLPHQWSSRKNRLPHRNPRSAPCLVDSPICPMRRRALHRKTSCVDASSPQQAAAPTRGDGAWGLCSLTLCQPHAQSGMPVGCRTRRRPSPARRRLQANNVRGWTNEGVPSYLQPIALGCPRASECVASTG